ncbi:riboflavin synthase alpha chain [Alkalibaculum bacchi]|uniref:Riboflavin synthase n=1 Tax=Alkalibaculum bacchi TaxID=645887 RepID=A0A366I8P8_9FIRM|nr:riboflavin synthase [Alkalibaculum bacchi]RBP65905.1 riboflavin synthase alpha chain [Alkalibaculum bacchi]
MFTGLVEEIGIVKNIQKTSQSARITIEASIVLEDVKLGDSICTNGVCLTVTNLQNNRFSVDVMPETVRASSLKSLRSGSSVNLERALKASDRLGGHIVSGHIDGVGIIQHFKEEENATWITIATQQSILKYIVERGSIAIDGTSLTVAYVDDRVFKVSIIPHTKEKTILLRKRIGDEVNLECDVIGKYVEKLTRYSNDSTINMDFLASNGFI